MNVWDFINAHVPDETCVALVIIACAFIYKMPPSTLDVAKEILLEFKDLFSNGMTSKGINALGGVLAFIFVISVMISDPIEKMIGLVAHEHESVELPHKEVIFSFCFLLILIYFIICVQITSKEK